ncbi:MAG TPA: SpoIIE family protein phosphatase [Acidimicrobiales bacterium]|nr:SpoIIE family protein phosphatase [Acidimicrobiales bacterium]
MGLSDLIDDGELVASELVANAVLHGSGCTGVEVEGVEGGARIEVADRSRTAPVVGMGSQDAMTGRGLRLVGQLARRWGVESRLDGKVVWAEVGQPLPDGAAPSAADLVSGGNDRPAGTTRKRFHVVLGEVPTDLLLAAKYHVDDVVREFALAATGASTGITATVPPHLQSLINTVAYRFSEARESIKRQALTAARRGASHTRLELELDAQTADAGEDYLVALDTVDGYCRAARLLTLETPPQHRVFRRWYVEELIVQVRALASGETPRPPQSFEDRLLQEIDRVAAAQRIAERSARLFEVASALAGADSPEAVADAVLDQGAAALGASGGGLVLASNADRLIVPRTVGYDEAVVARLRSESRDADLPAAVVLRTGESVWIESRLERDMRYPELVELEPATVSVCAVPLEVQGRRLGALRFSFNEPRLFDEDERRFVLTLAAQSAQALERAQLQHSRIDISRRLQRSLLPPTILAIPGVEAAAFYHPLGDGVDVGGDFYDLWKLDDNFYAIAVGDVAGTGPEAAAFTARVRYSLRALTLLDADVGPTMERLNHALLTSNAEGIKGERFCTVIFGTVRSHGDRLEVVLASGGHPYPFIRRADGSVEEVVLGGTLLGIFTEPEVVVVHRTLGPGDRLVLYTDGVIEARDKAGRMFDAAGVRAQLSDAQAGGTARATVERLQDAVMDHVGGELADDMAALVLRVGRDGADSDSG